MNTHLGTSLYPTGQVSQSHGKPSSQTVHKRKAECIGRSVSESDAAEPSLSKAKRPCSLDLKVQERSAFDLLLDSLKDELNKCQYKQAGEVIYGKEGHHKLYFVSGDKVYEDGSSDFSDGHHKQTTLSGEQKIFVHALYSLPKSEEHRNSLFEGWASEFWELAFKLDITKVISLSGFFWNHPSYLPVGKNFEVIEKVQEGSERVFANDYKIKVQAVEQIEGMDSSYCLTIQLVSPNEQVRHIAVDQIRCWGDAFPLSPKMVGSILERLDDANIQIHCEAGKNRSPALVVMHKLSGMKLKEDSLISDVASCIHEVRCRRQLPDSMEKNALQSILQYALSRIDMSVEDFASIFLGSKSTKITAMPHTAPVISGKNSYFT